jgi:hypothetical protein
MTILTEHLNAIIIFLKFFVSKCQCHSTTYTFVFEFDILRIISRKLLNYHLRVMLIYINKYKKSISIKS